jgi:F-type H+-transporting ATPase subunit delta
VNVDPVTVRWAGALYGLAQKRGALEQVVRDVQRIAKAVAEPELRRRIVNPHVPRAERRAALDPLLAGAHALTRNFVHLLLDRGREEVLFGLGAAFHRRGLDERRQLEGVVESARPLEPAQVQEIAAKLGGLMQRELLLQNRVVPELIGGARVIAGTRMLDGSVRGRLEQLRKRLLEAPLA